jgi:hypothetical protein
MASAMGINKSRPSLKPATPTHIATIHIGRVNARAVRRRAAASALDRGAEAFSAPVASAGTLGFDCGTAFNEALNDVLPRSTTPAAHQALRDAADHAGK